MTNNLVTSEIEKIPIDTKLLSDTIIELNISRRNVAIYPKNHPTVEKSLYRAFDFLRQLLELRPEITLAVAKDTLIIDDYYLDKKNPVYKEFALHLNKLSIAYVTFIIGLTKDELYTFHHFISDKQEEASIETIQSLYKELDLIHIRSGFIDYGTFSFEKGKTRRENPDVQLWERYVYALIEGTLQEDDLSAKMKEIPPEVFAQVFNKASEHNIKEETYDRVITSYIRRSTDTAFSSQELKRLLNFINTLKPELKKQFLSTSVRKFSADIDITYRALKNVSFDEIIKLLSTINEQKISVPESLKNLLDKLSELPENSNKNYIFEGNHIFDDIFISPDILELFEESNTNTFISTKYQKEIKKLLSFDKTNINSYQHEDLKKEYSDEIIEREFVHIILELFVHFHKISEEEYQTFTEILKEQSYQFIQTGQYKVLLQILHVLESNFVEEKYSDITLSMLNYCKSLEFISNLIESFRILGRQTREEAWLLCECYGEQIIPHLMDALAQEDSQAVRKFLLSLLKQFGEKVIPETLKRLSDNRWFVKRNMIYILNELEREETVTYIRSCCRDKNFKVRIEALKCLLNFRDPYSIEMLKEYLYSESKELIMHGVALSGSFRVTEVVPDLICLLKKKSMTGTDLYEKIPVIKSLGDIGDPQAINALQDLLFSKSIFFKKVTKKLKEEIYKTLKNYPYEAIKDLIRKGLKSKNEYIREESLSLLKEKVD